jgi:glycosyltransferase involved in cell wall biosynthesis
MQKTPTMQPVMPEAAQPGADPPTGRRVAIFVSFSGQGGVERMIGNLAGGMAAQGFAVDLVLAKAGGAHLQQPPPGVRLVKLRAGHTFTSLFALARYLRTQRPAALLAAKDRAIKTAVLARWLSGTRPRLVGRLGTTVSAALADKGRARRWLWYQGMRRFYRHVDQIIAVSQGVADDVMAITGLPANRVMVVRNPVVGPTLPELAQQPVDHPWFGGDGPPVLLGAGRLTAQKDFPALLDAFARVRAQRPCRLVILGEGRLRSELQRQAANLGVAEDVSLPGFAPNPYAYMARAAVFVLSSAWEGSPNVLTEAMAVGTPVVATDCPSGPREILQGGRYGPLVPVGDAPALAQAILEVLDAPLERATLRRAVAEYSVERSAAHYLQALGLA